MTSVLPFLDHTPQIAPHERPALSRDYLEDVLSCIDVPLALSSIPGLLKRPELLQIEPLPKKRKLDNDTSKEATARPDFSAILSTKPETAVSLAPLIEQPFDKAQLAAMNKEGLSRGRAQKHAGDAHHRSSATVDQHQGVLELADALLVYVYAFWCHDHLHGRVVDGVSKPFCEKANWQSIFPMLKYTRDIARDAGIGWEAVVGLANLLEGLVLEHMTHFARRQLHNRIDASQQRQRDSNHSDQGHTPGSTGPSPPSASSQAGHEESEEHLRAFLRLSSDMEAKARFFNAALFARNAPFAQQNLRRILPHLYARAMTNDTPLSAQVDLRGGPEARWSWPIDLANGPNALAHAAAMGRAVLEEVAEQQNLKGWRGVGLSAPST